MKKTTLIAFLMALVLAFTMLSGCGQRNEPDPPYSPTQAETSAPIPTQPTIPTAEPNPGNPSTYGIDQNETRETYHAENASGDIELEATPEVERELVLVANETELRAAVAQAGHTPTTIALTANIELVSNFAIPSGADITLRSNEDSGFSLIAIRNMDAVEIQRNASLTIENIGVTRCGTHGSGVNNSGNFTMNHGNVSGHSDGGVINSGNFIMNGGTIDNNRASTRVRRAGGVTNTGTFTMHDGIISDNTGHRGGGGVDNEGTFTMLGGTIRGNNSSGQGGARAIGAGGVNNHGIFVMYSGTITGNSDPGSGGVSNSNNFVMHDGVISGNTSSHSGGGVTNRVHGTFTMNGGIVDNNSANLQSGGGVRNYGVFTMTAGVISNNISRRSGGGFFQFTGSFTKEGGWIFSNTASREFDVDIHGGNFSNNVFDPNVGAIGSSPHNLDAIADTNSGSQPQTESITTDTENTPADLVGNWLGSFGSEGNVHVMSLRIVERDGNYPVVIFFIIPEASGSYAGEVIFNAHTGRFEIHYSAVDIPPGWRSSAILFGTLQGDVFSGYIDTQNEPFSVTRTQ